MNPIEAQVLERVRPSPDTTRKARKAAQELGRRLTKEAAAHGTRVTTALVGSVAKDTHLRHAVDLDLFILFPRSVDRGLLESQGLRWAKSHLRQIELRYAEHPYVRGRYEGFDFDVVPAYRVRSGADLKSSVDRTPFHTRYVRKHLSREARDHVRLLKQWLRGIEAYGAETGVGGISGYLAELLILHHGTFAATVAAMAEWTPTVRLALDGMDATELGGPLVFVDPVDGSRNAAAAVTEQQLGRVRAAARAYVRKPSLRFFFPPPPVRPDRRMLSEAIKGKTLVGLRTPAPPTHEQGKRPHAQRLQAKVTRELEGHGFQVVRDAVHSDGKGFLLLWQVKPGTLPATRTHRGPSASDAKHADRFRRRWEGTADVHEREGRLWVEAPVEPRRPAELVRRRLGRLLRGTRWPPSGRKAMRVLTNDQLEARAAWRAAVHAFVTGQEPWERPDTD